MDPLYIGAFVAGLFMFLAPCTLPIVPGYLAFIAGVPLSMLADPTSRARARWLVIRNALAFVCGFSLVFIMLGASAGFLGAFIGPWRGALSQLGGLIIIVFGITMLGIVRVPFLSQESRVALPSFLRLGTLPSSALIGALFAVGWSPCIGPILATILLFASSTSTVWYGAALLAIFSAGLAVPFILTALLITEASVFLSRMQGFVRTLSIVGGASLILIGILMVSGQMALLVSWGYGLLDSVGYESLLQYL